MSPPNTDYYKLDETKNKLLEDNHGFIINTANKFKQSNQDIDINDLVDICTMGFIKCLKHYDGKSKITTYSKRMMVWELLHYKNSKLYKGIEKEINLDDIDDEICYNNKRNNKDIKKIIMRKVKNKFSKRDKNIIKMYIFDKRSMIDIGIKYNISRERVRQIINKFKKYCRENLSEDELVG